MKYFVDIKKLGTAAIDDKPRWGCPYDISNKCSSLICRNENSQKFTLQAKMYD